MCLYIELTTITNAPIYVNFNDNPAPKLKVMDTYTKVTSFDGITYDVKETPLQIQYKIEDFKRLLNQRDAA